MFYEHAIDDVTRVFGGASEQGNIEIVFFKTGLTGSTGLIHRKGPEEHKAQMHKSLNSEEIILTGTLITRIGRIYTDPRVSASSAQSVVYRTPPLIDDDKKPQINVDKRRFIAINHCEECKAEHEYLNRSMEKNETTINTELVRTETNSGNAKVIFQTGLIGCVLSFNPVIEQWVAQWT